MFYDTVIQGAEILDRNDGKTYQVGIKDGRIAYIGQEPVQGSLVIDGRDHLLAPGLVNAHTHIAMTLFRSYADDMPGLPQPMAKPVLMRIQLYLIRGTASKMTGFM